MVTVAGGAFQSGAKVAISGGGFKFVSVSVVSSTLIDVVVTVSTTARAGTRTVTIFNPDGGKVSAKVLSVT
jgi:multidrug efflux pump subunit AcrA (membrane-fusion protein)